MKILTPQAKQADEVLCALKSFYGPLLTAPQLAVVKFKIVPTIYDVSSYQKCKDELGSASL